jgi:hypothetical protein
MLYVIPVRGEAGRFHDHVDLQDYTEVSVRKPTMLDTYPEIEIAKGMRRGILSPQ